MHVAMEIDVTWHDRLFSRQGVLFLTLVCVSNHDMFISALFSVSSIIYKSILQKHEHFLEYHSKNFCCKGISKVHACSFLNV